MLIIDGPYLDTTGIRFYLLFQQLQLKGIDNSLQ